MPSMTTASEGLWRIGRASRYIGVTADTLRTWAAAGDVPAIRTPDGQYRFSPTELDQWLESRRVKAS
jgi:excisionase family DNA binding protein